MSKSFLRLLSVAVLTLAASSAAAQSFKLPHVLTDSAGDDADEARFGVEQVRHEDKAFPDEVIDAALRAASANANAAVGRLSPGNKGNWQALGPKTPFVPGPVTYTGVQNVVSGRITALALSPSCASEDGEYCRILVGAAGGGVWSADNALSNNPAWHSSNQGIPTNAIGSLTFDPTDPSGRTVYAGTGEANQSADSEAGNGLFRSTDGGESWSVVPGSVDVAKDRGISAIRIDPANPRHILIGTTPAERGATATGGGASQSVPNAPAVGLYESFDRGRSFTLVLPYDTYEIAFDPSDAATVYAATAVNTTPSPGGVWRRSPRLDHDNAFHQVLAPVYDFERTSIAVTRKSGHTRVYATRGDGSGANNAADLLRADNANVPAGALLASGWSELSNPTPGTPGFGSASFCGNALIGSQCWYDMYVATPPGRPDEVWIGGAMQYSEIFFSPSPSNGRAVQRSTNAGVSFTDMTNDTNNLGMHPDQHAIAFAGKVTFVGSDGGLMRVNGPFVDASSQCDARGVTGPDLVDCRQWLSAIPTRLTSLNDGLATLQFQSVSINHHDPLSDIMGGTQDNGTWAFTGKAAFESVGGDGGWSAVDIANANTRMHTYTGRNLDVNFRGTDIFGWNFISDPFFVPPRESFAFYAPLVNDPKVSGTWFFGGQHVWRTQDNGGSQDYLEQHCNEITGDFTAPCGDWEKLGVPTLTSPLWGDDKRQGTSYVVAIARASTNKDTLWAATRRGRVFVSTNASAKTASQVTFTRIDTNAQPNRFVSSIVLDGSDGNHAFISFSGYSAVTPTQPGHIFDVHYNPGTGTATWTEISSNLGDQPITGLGLDDLTGNLYAATEFGVAMLSRGVRTWVPAANGLPPVAVYNLALDAGARVMYAATHGRGAFKLDLSNKGNDEVASRN